MDQPGYSGADREPNGEADQSGPQSIAKNERPPGSAVPRLQSSRQSLSYAGGRTLIYPTPADR